MNITETEQIMSYLWSMYPNAPKMTENEKTESVTAWFGLLHEYSIADVWEAVKKAIREQPRFVPSAPEILAKCKKTLIYDASFMPPEYFEYRKAFAGYRNEDGFTTEGWMMIHGRIRMKLSCPDVGNREELEEILAHNEEQRRLAWHIRQLEERFADKAEAFYDATQRRKIELPVDKQYLTHKQSELTKHPRLLPGE